MYNIAIIVLFAALNCFALVQEIYDSTVTDNIQLTTPTYSKSDTICIYKDSSIQFAHKDSVIDTVPRYVDDTYEPTGFLDRDAVLSFNDATRYFKITGDHVVYQNGRKYLLETDSIQITDATGHYKIWYDTNQTMQVGSEFPNFHVPLLSEIYWNTDIDEGVCGDERHSYVMDWATHKHFHTHVGALYSGVGLGLTADDTIFTLEAGAIDDEDIRHSHGDVTKCLLFYYNGGAAMVWDSASTTLYKGTAGALYYNDGTTLTAAGANSYLASFVFGTNEINGKPAVIIGQRTDVTLADAKEYNTVTSLTTAGFEIDELVLLYIVFWRNDATPFEEIVDYRQAKINDVVLSGGGSGTTDHALQTHLSYETAAHTGFASGTNNKADSSARSDSLGGYASDYYLSVKSVGAETLPAVYDNGDGTIEVGAGSVNLRSTTDHSGSILTYSIDSTSGVALTDGTFQILSAEYNSGTPQYVLKTYPEYPNGSDEAGLWLVWRVGTDFHSCTLDELGKGLANKVNTRLICTKLYDLNYQDYGSLVCTESSSPTNRTILVSEGTVWAGNDTIHVAAFNSSTDTMTRYYHSSGAWVYDDIPRYDSLYYDNGTDLVALGNNNFGVRWSFRSIGDAKQVFIVYGSQAHNKLSEAEQEQPPSMDDLPYVVRWHSMLVGKTIVEYGASTGITQAIVRNPNIPVITSVPSADSARASYKSDTLINNIDTSKVTGLTTALDTKLDITDTTAIGDRFVRVRGDTMTGDLSIGSNYINNDGSTSEGLKFLGGNRAELRCAPIPFGDVRYNASYVDNGTLAEGNGGGIAFYGVWDNTGTETVYGGIHAYKASSTNGNYSGQLHFQTRLHNNSPITCLKLTENGDMATLGHYINNGGTAGEGLKFDPNNNGVFYSSSSSGDGLSISNFYPRLTIEDRSGGGTEAAVEINGLNCIIGGITSSTNTQLQASGSTVIKLNSDGTIQTNGNYINNDGTASEGLTFDASNNATFTEGLTVGDSIINAKLTAHLLSLLPISDTSVFARDNDLALKLDKVAFSDSLGAHFGDDNYIPKISGYNLVNSIMLDTGSTITINGYLKLPNGLIQDDNSDWKLFFNSATNTTVRALDTFDIDLRTAYNSRLKINDNGSLQAYGNPLNYDGSATDGLSFDANNNGVFTENLSVGKSSFETWLAGVSLFQLGGNNTLMGTANETASSGLLITNNVRYQGSGDWRRISTGKTSHIQLIDGSFRVFTDGTGAADSSFTTTQNFRIDSNGTVLTYGNYINNDGTASEGLKFDPNNNGGFYSSSSSGGGLSISNFYPRLTIEDRSGGGTEAAVEINGLNCIIGGITSSTNTQLQASGSTVIKLNSDGTIQTNGNYINNDGTASEGLTFDASNNATFTEALTVNGQCNFTQNAYFDNDINAGDLVISNGEMTYYKTYTAVCTLKTDFGVEATGTAEKQIIGNHVWIRLPVLVASFGVTENPTYANLHFPTGWLPDLKNDDPVYFYSVRFENTNPVYGVGVTVMQYTDDTNDYIEYPNATGALFSNNYSTTIETYTIEYWTE